jgi:pimeloyl-ACP methyl ester carboxylesterase
MLRRFIGNLKLSSAFVALPGALAVLSGCNAAPEKPPATEFAMNSAKHCTAADGVRKISVPLYPDRSDSPVFTYSYKLFPSSTASAPTIVVLPGGPGGTLLDRNPNEAYADGAIPTNRFNIIYTDPRGAGCNQLSQGEFPSDSFRTEYLANDVARMIQTENLAHYSIFGASFGTVLATYTFHRIEELGLPTPKAVVLEGTLGKGVPGKFDEYIGGFAAEWQRIQTRIPSAMANLFSGAALPLGFSAQVWGQYFYKPLILGEAPGYGPLFQAELRPLLTGDVAGTARLKAKLQAYADLLRQPPSARMNRLFQTLGCQELFGSWRSEILLENGTLMPGGDDICEGFSYDPYDSAKLRISAPIYYFQGPFDPATPWASARYHYENQKNAKRSFITVSGASHAPLTLSLKVLGCSDSIWKQIDESTDTSTLSTVGCQGWKIDVESKPVGE